MGKTADGRQSLLIPQSLNRVELRRLSRGIISEEDTHGGRKNSSGDNGLDRDQCRPGKKITDQRRTNEPKEDSDSAAHHAEGYRFHQELALHVSLRRSDGHAHADLAGSLSYRYKHDIHDPDAAHQQRD